MAKLKVANFFKLASSIITVSATKTNITQQPASHPTSIIQAGIIIETISTIQAASFTPTMDPLVSDLDDERHIRKAIKESRQLRNEKKWDATATLKTKKGA